jgi:hypothetical protein
VDLMRNRIYEVDSDGILHDDIEESEDVLDLDDAHVLNFVDVDHERLESTLDRRNEGRGFYEQLEDMLPEDEEIEEMLAALDAMDSELGTEAHEG